MPDFSDLKSSLKQSIMRRLPSAPLQIELWNGVKVQTGAQPKLTLIIRHPKALARLILRPGFSSLGEAYVEDEIDFKGPILNMIAYADELGRILPKLALPAIPIPRLKHSRRVDRKAISHHYDVSNDFYETWLDSNMVYSCAYFEKGNENLDQAQEAKLDYICRKLQLKPGDRFLDIGCGWGALVRWAARHYGVKATGITISANQYRYALARVRDENLGADCEIQLSDYRDFRAQEPFDKIASVGMFEHVGFANLPIYFKAINRALKPGGLVLNHGISSMELDGAKAGGSDAGHFVDRYVFPHEELPHISLASRAMAAQGFELADMESLRPHYARTTKLWVERIEQNQARLEAISGTRKYRTWRAYLAGSSYAFNHGWISVYQMLAVKREAKGLWPFPMTRAHLYGVQTSAPELRVA